MASIANLSLPAPHGNLRTRIYRSRVDAALPGLLYLHGGGFMLVSIDTHDTLCRLLTRECDAAVISIDYRLAPKNRFPVAVDECGFACDWLMKHCAEHRVDATRLAVGGDSSGANLALAVSNQHRASFRAAPKFLYPGTPHGFLRMATEVEGAARAVRHAANHLKKHCVH